MFLSDQETATDLLQYEAIAKTVVQLIRDRPGSPVTVGVHGDWGAGKSSVLRMIESSFAGDKKVLCLWFNGWAFEGFEDAKTVVIETIIEELRRARPRSQKVMDAAAKLLKRVDWLKAARKAGGLAFNVVTGVPSLSQVGDLIAAAKSYFGKRAEELTSEEVEAFSERALGFLKPAEAESVPAHIHAFRKEFVELLEAAEVEQLIVIVDDLDRCLPETSIATLEAIRLFLFVERTAFVVGADEAMIEYAVRGHFPDLPPAAGPVSYARNYLEKLIQVPFRIPALGPAETRTYITLLLVEAELGGEHEGFQKLLATAREDMVRPWLSKGLSASSMTQALAGAPPEVARQALLLSGQLTDTLTEGTRGNPRQIKRFLNLMKLRQAVGEARGFGKDISTPVLAKLMLAERFRPDVFEEIAREAGVSADGKSSKLSAFEAVVTGTLAPEPRGAHKPGTTHTTLPNRTEFSPTVEEWMKNDWVRTWASISPPLGDLDLRPYIFVTRDKRTGLAGATASTKIEQLTEALAAGGMRMKAVASDVKTLSSTDAAELFDAVHARIMEADSFKTIPPAIPGLIDLVRAHPDLEQRLLEFARSIPVSKGGAWMPAQLDQVFQAADTRRGYDDLRKSWTTQTENPILQRAAGAMEKIK